MAVDVETSGRRTAAPTGPPLLVLAVGGLSLAVSLLLAVADASTATHLLGYATGALVPILVIGVARKSDLERRRSAAYQPVSWFRIALVVLGALALVAALAHAWPRATEWAS